MIMIMSLQPVRTPTPAARMVSAAPLRPQSPISTAAPTLSSPSPQPVKVTTPSIPTPPLQVRAQLQQQQQISLTQTTKASTPTHIRPPVTPVHVKTAAVKMSTLTKPPAPSLLPKTSTKEKEKKSFSSAGYT